MVINNERVAWIDATRMFAMLTVVLAHSIGASHMPNQTELIWWKRLGTTRELLLGDYNKK